MCGNIRTIRTENQLLLWKTFDRHWEEVVPIRSPCCSLWCQHIFVDLPGQDPFMHLQSASLHCVLALPIWVTHPVTTQTPLLSGAFLVVSATCMMQILIFCASVTVNSFKQCKIQCPIVCWWDCPWRVVKLSWYPFSISRKTFSQDGAVSVVFSHVSRMCWNSPPSWWLYAITPFYKTIALKEKKRVIWTQSDHHMIASRVWFAAVLLRHSFLAPKRSRFCPWHKYCSWRCCLKINDSIRISTIG